MRVTTLETIAGRVVEDALDVVRSSAIEPNYRAPAKMPQFAPEFTLAANDGGAVILPFRMARAG